jgi:hypothetical protein
MSLKQLFVAVLAALFIIGNGVAIAGRSWYHRLRDGQAGREGA